jgi:hypothetical protein
MRVTGFPEITWDRSARLRSFLNFGARLIIPSPWPKEGTASFGIAQRSEPLRKGRLRRKTVGIGMEADRPFAINLSTDAPPWASVELIEQTIRIWQPFSENRLGRDDALSFLFNVAELFDAVGLFAPREQEREDEAVHRPCESQQPRTGA